MLHGQQLVAGTRSAQGTERFKAVNPATGEQLDTDFHEATTAEVDAAVRAAADAFAAFRSMPGRATSAFLNGIAEALQAEKEPIVARAHAETGLPLSRLKNECDRM